MWLFCKTEDVNILWISSVHRFVLPFLLSKKISWYQLYSYATDCHRIFSYMFSSVQMLHSPSSDKVFPINRFVYHYKIFCILTVSLISVEWENNTVISQYTRRFLILVGSFYIPALISFQILFSLLLQFQPAVSRQS